MKAAQLTGYKKFEFVEVDRPSPKEGQVLIKTERVSICGSDLRTYDRAHPEESYPFKIGAPCHESLGEVVESRSSELSVGDKVKRGDLIADSRKIGETIIPSNPGSVRRSRFCVDDQVCRATSYLREFPMLDKC